MAYISLIEMLGYTNNAKIMMETFRDSSNIITTDNPPFTVDDFSGIFPQFPINTGSPDSVPTEVFNLFKAMADASIKYDRYKTSWMYFMCLYIAHNITLWLKVQQGDGSARAALANSLPTGIVQSKSVDGLSISYDFIGMETDLQGYGTWKLTTYGQQLATLTRMYGHGGMWVNG